MKGKERMLDKNNMTLKLEKMTMSQVNENQMSKNELSRKISLREKGITLIALVVTIIILLILAGVTLNMALSDNGLFSKTKEAVEKYKQAQSDEEEAIKEIEKQLGDITSNKTTVSPSTPTPKPEDEGPNGKKLIKTIDEFAESNKEVEDSLGNPVVIPKGFKFVGNEGDTVKEGIVIQDEEGNEFVWIPVSNIDGDNNEATTDNQNDKDLITIEGDKKVEITLGRYTFDATNGNPHLEQSGSQCEESNHVIESYYEENTINTQAKELKGFVDSVQKNHGYYIARYEAAKGNNNKPFSKPNMGVWRNIKPSDASAVCGEMYTSDNFTSDLMNSYAWDTAIVYIQSMGNANYANQRPTNTSFLYTGTSDDEVCSIYDMAGEVLEWTTEKSSGTQNNINFSTVARGGGIYSTDNISGYYTANRYRSYWDIYYYNCRISFRPLLYLE